MTNLHCSEAERLIVLDLDEGLDQSKRELLEHHLRECALCRQARQEIGTILSAVASDVPEDPGEEFWNRYHSSLQARLQETRPRSAWNFAWKIAVPLLAAAATLAFIAFHTGTFQPNVREAADRIINSPALIEELDRLYGPLSEEISTAVLVRNQSVATIGVKPALYDDTVVRWFEVEDDPAQLSF